MILLLIFKVQKRTKKDLNWKSFQRLRKETDIWRLLRVRRYPTATNVNFTGQVNPSQLRQRPRAICLGLQPNIQQTALFEAFDPASINIFPLSSTVEKPEKPPTQGPGISQETTQLLFMRFNDPEVTELSMNTSQSEIQIYLLASEVVGE